MCGGQAGCPCVDPQGHTKSYQNIPKDHNMFKRLGDDRRGTAAVPRSTSMTEEEIRVVFVFRRRTLLINSRELDGRT